jgi:HSP20 family protein
MKEGRMGEQRFALVRITPASVVKHAEIDEQVPAVEPLADIYETPDAFVVKLDIPGAAKEMIRLQMGGGEMSVHAPVRRQLPRNADVLFSEIPAKQYRRSFRIGSGVDQDGARAHYEEGVLTIVLPKTDALKRREITIQ